ncbi:MAG: hypothetical protein KatS3mg061_2620 [Dehalococcoidia bacterium]|nr:MAG: hypothetical protein KatS3mg061_2620 [Dehalococcoidia bacterium]
MRGDGSPSPPALPPDAETQAYHELQAYTLPHPDPAFLHQHVVDAWTAQHANAQTEPIG